MSVSHIQDDAIDYPESDGQPIGETDWHIDWTLQLRDMLKYRYRGQDIYVGSDMLLYYIQGDPHRFVVPDGFVVLNCPTHKRRTFQTWKEKRVPNVVFEFTSRSTKREDEENKPRVYAKIGVQEYFIFDPHGEYLSPQLQGHRLEEDHTYTPILPDSSGRLICKELGLTLELDDGDLLIRDAQSGVKLPTKAEANALEAEAKSREAEANAREAEKLSLKADQLASQNKLLESEILRLKEQLRRRDN